MDRRQHLRVAAYLPVRLWGVNKHDQPFMETARARNISSKGAVIQGMTHQVEPGELLEVQFGEDRAHFRVVWVGRPGTRRAGEIGIESLPSEPRIWDEDLCRYGQIAAEG